jgi:hypothetical protein
MIGTLIVHNNDPISGMQIYIPPAWAMLIVGVGVEAVSKAKYCQHFKTVVRAM